MSTVSFRKLVSQWMQYPIDQDGYLSDDNSYSTKSILRDLLDIRADEIKNALGKGETLSEFMVQTLGSVLLEEVNRDDVSTNPAKGFYWLKSKEPLPVPIVVTAFSGIIAHPTTPGFDFIKWDRFQFIPQSRNITMRNGKYYTIREIGTGSYLYIYNDRFLDSVAISGIWEDPIEVKAYPTNGIPNKDAICNPLEVDCYTDAWLRKLIIARSWQTILAAKATAPRDLLNDDRGPDPPTK